MATVGPSTRNLASAATERDELDLLVAQMLLVRRRRPGRSPLVIGGPLAIAIVRTAGGEAALLVGCQPAPSSASLSLWGKGQAGTKWAMERTGQTRILDHTGLGSHRAGNRYVAHPDEVRGLRRGKAFAGAEALRLNVRPAHER